MTKAQALALMNALEAVQMPAAAAMNFDASGVESWTVQLSSSVIYTGAQLGQLTSYCASRGLSVTAQFTTLGVV